MNYYESILEAKHKLNLAMDENKSLSTQGKKEDGFIEWLFCIFFF